MKVVRSGVNYPFSFNRIMPLPVFRVIDVCKNKHVLGIVWMYRPRETEPFRLEPCFALRRIRIDCIHVLTRHCGCTVRVQRALYVTVPETL